MQSCIAQLYASRNYEAFPSIAGGEYRLRRINNSGAAAINSIGHDPYGRIQMKNGNNTRHEIDSKEPKEEPGLYEYLDGLEAEIGDLTGRLRQIKAISVMSRRSLEETLACSCCAGDILNGVFSAIENISVTVE